MRLSTSLLAAIFSPLVSSACTRAGISTALDQFFLSASSIIKKPLNLAPNVKISSNGYIQPSLNSTPWANISTL
jgi:hypothetical protein